MVEIEGLLKKTVCEDDLPKKMITYKGKRIEGVLLADVVGVHPIRVVAKDGYEVHFRKEDVENLVLFRGRILSPHEGLSIKDVARIIVEEEREPSSIIRPTPETLHEAVQALHGTAKEYRLSLLLPPSFSHIIVYSRDGYHASFSHDEAKKVFIDKEGNLFSATMMRARRVRLVERIEVYG